MNNLIQDQIQQDLTRHSHLHPFDLYSHDINCSQYTKEYLLHCLPFIEAESTCSRFNDPKSIQQFTEILKEAR